MNRRGFLKGILAACVAPGVFAPVLEDRFRWQAQPNGNGLYIAEFHYATIAPSKEEMENIIFFFRNDGARPAVAPVITEPLQAGCEGLYLPDQTRGQWKFVNYPNTLTVQCRGEPDGRVSVEKILSQA
jgi:hypothetical protein